jgi:hypothetical protein
VTPGFVRAHSPFWFRNSQQKLRHYRIRNSQRNRFHRWRVDSSALVASVYSEIFNEKYHRCRMGNHQRNNFQRRHVDSETLTAPQHTESVPPRKSSRKHIPKVTRWFGSARSPCWHRKSQRNNFQRWRVDDTTKRLMSSPKCRSVEVINNPARPGSNHREVNCINYK